MSLKAYCPKMHLTSLIKVECLSIVKYRFTYFNIALRSKFEVNSINPTKPGNEQNVVTTEVGVGGLRH